LKCWPVIPAWAAMCIHTISAWMAPITGICAETPFSASMPVRLPWIPMATTMCPFLSASTSAGHTTCAVSVSGTWRRTIPPWAVMRRWAAVPPSSASLNIPFLWLKKCASRCFMTSVLSTEILLTSARPK
jgi:Outer membrane protein/protective antigen OMA87